MYALDKHEWVILGQLQDVLKVKKHATPLLHVCLSMTKPMKPKTQILKDATLFFSRSMVNLAMAIPAMDYIDKVFTTGMLNDEGFDPAICAAVGLAKKTLNKYYSLTDLSRVYCIAMGKGFPATRYDYDTDTLFQSCILGISWTISGRQNGQRTGLALHKPLFATYMTCYMFLFVSMITWDPSLTPMSSKSR